MSVSSVSAVWHIAYHAAPAVVTVGPNNAYDALERAENPVWEQLSAAAEVGSVVQNMVRATPERPVAVLLEASPSALLRLVPHLPALAKTPVVFHIATRGDHADVLLLRQSGLTMFYASNAAQAQDYALAAHELAARTSTGVIHFFDANDADVSLLSSDALNGVPRNAVEAPCDDAAIDAALAEARGEVGRLLGYPADSVGRRLRMAPVRLREDWTVAVALENLRDHGGREQAAIVSVPVVSPQARLTGVVDVSVLVTQPLDARVSEIMREPVSAVATEDAEEVARLCADRRLWTVPVTDSEGRLIGVFTVADALEVLDEESTEDAARAGGVEPLGRPYLATSVLALMRSRITWLLVLAIGATLTVQVLGHKAAHRVPYLG